MQVLYLGRAPGTKETLPDFREKCRVTRHSRVFGLTGSYRPITRCINVRLCAQVHASPQVI